MESAVSLRRPFSPCINWNPCKSTTNKQRHKQTNNNKNKQQQHKQTTITHSKIYQLSLNKGTGVMNYLKVYSYIYNTFHKFSQIKCYISTLYLIKTLIITYAPFKWLMKRLRIDTCNIKWPYKGKYRYMNYEAFNEIWIRLHISLSKTIAILPFCFISVKGTWWAIT